VEARTRGIEVSCFTNSAITLAVWDMAGQEEFHLVHNAFFPDLSIAEGKATTFIVVCRSDKDIKSQLKYWLQYIASSCHKDAQTPRHVFIVMNKIGGVGETGSRAEELELVLKYARDTFKQHLQINDKPFVMDVRERKGVEGLKNAVLEHSNLLLQSHKVPEICQGIQKELIPSMQNQNCPVLYWTDFVQQVQRLWEPWPEETVEAAAKYLNEAGVIIYLENIQQRLVVLDPKWFCNKIIGKVFLPREIANPREIIFREQVD
jgi:GTPase SAR1 family protein